MNKYNDLEKATERRLFREANIYSSLDLLKAIPCSYRKIGDRIIMNRIEMSFFIQNVIVRNIFAHNQHVAFSKIMAKQKVGHDVDREFNGAMFYGEFFGNDGITLRFYREC